MADLLSRVEVTKLASDLGGNAHRLDFLAEHDAGQVRELRMAISAAMFSRNKDKLARIAAMSNRLPASLTAKIAQVALGPMLSARVAGVLAPDDAVKLAKHLDRAFLTELSMGLEPKRVEPILRRLPGEMVIDVGRRLLERGEHITLGRFVASVDVEAAVGVVEGASGSDLLKVALYTEDPKALDAIVQRLSGSTLAGVLRAAAIEDSFDDALTLLAHLGDASSKKLLEQLDGIGPEDRAGLVTAVTRNDSWEDVLPGIDGLDGALRRDLLHHVVTLNASVIDRVMAVAREHGLASVVETLAELGFEG